MKVSKPALFLRYLGWMLCFVQAGLFLLNKIPFDSRSVFVFVFFFVVAVFAGSNNQNNKPILTRNTDTRVRIADQIYKGDSLHILELRGGGLFIDVDLSKPSKPDKDEPTPTKHPVKSR